MTTQHTPRPWTYDEGDQTQTVVRLSDGALVYIQGTNEQAAADARLIAAAPDLLAALEEVVRVHTQYNDGPERAARFSQAAIEARAAIARARGAAETREERNARILRELDALVQGMTIPEMAGCKVCGEIFEGQRYSGQLCSKPCRTEQRKRTRQENKP